jgi:chromosome segregation ATPase
VAPPPAPRTTAPERESSPPAASETPATAPADEQGARETPLDAEAVDARIRRRLEEYNQRHEERERVMASYDKASGADPHLERFADPRKLQVELNDELDREQTSNQLGIDFEQMAHEVASKEQGLNDLLGRKLKKLDASSNPNAASNRHDLETALASLAQLPESPEVLERIRTIDSQLSEIERSENELPAQRTQAQQEVAGLTEELAKLKALEQHYEKESKAFAADALAARQNQLGLADWLEYYTVVDQAEDLLEQGRKTTDSVQHLPASPHTAKTLNGPTRSPDPAQLWRCLQQSGDVQGCRQKARAAQQE